MTKPKLPGKLVLIIWTDAASMLGFWEDRDDLTLLKPATCYSVGFVVEETSEHKTLVMTTSDRVLLARIAIPLRCIKSIHAIGFVPKRRKAARKGKA